MSKSPHPKCKLCGAYHSLSSPHEGLSGSLPRRIATLERTFAAADETPALPSSDIADALASMRLDIDRLSRRVTDLESRDRDIRDIDRDIRDIDRDNRDMSRDVTLNVTRIASDVTSPVTGAMSPAERKRLQRARMAGKVT